MRHDLRIVGHRFRLRPATAGDAGFIVSLRTDPQLARYLHVTSPRIEDQLAWQAAYEARPGDYYFIVEDSADDAPVGAIGVYDVAGAAAEWGRWLIAPGSMAAVESAALILRVAFETLGLDEVYTRTIADNAQVVSFHDSLGAIRRRTIASYAKLADGVHDAVEHAMDRAIWTRVAPRLDLLAQRAAR